MWLLISLLFVASYSADVTFTQSRVASDCDRENMIQGVHVNIKFKSEPLGLIKRNEALNEHNLELCLYTTMSKTIHEARQSNCKQLKKGDYATTRNGIDNAKWSMKGLWYHMHWYNGMSVCDITDSFEILGINAKVEYESFVVVVEGAKTSHVLYADTGVIVQPNGVVKSKPTKRFPIDEYTKFDIVKDFGREPYVDLNKRKKDKIDEAYFITNTYDHNPWNEDFPGRQVAGISIVSDANYIHKPLIHEVPASKFKYIKGYSDMVVIRSTESNMNNVVLSKIGQIRVDSAGEDRVTFDKLMVIVKSGKHWYVPVVDVDRKIALTDNTNEQDDGNKQTEELELTKDWCKSKTAKDFTPTIFGGTWRYKQRIDSNSGGLTYTRTREDTKSTTDTTATNIVNTVEDGWSLAGQFQLCLSGTGAGGRVSGCVHVGGSQEHSSSTGKETDKLRSNTLANIKSSSCAVTIACTAPSHTKLSDLERLDATSAACYAYQWIAFAWDTESNQLEEVETCSFVVIDKYGNTPQCSESSCDDKTDCQKCINGLEPLSNSCPIIFGEEYDSENNLKVIQGMSVAHDDLWCADLCYKEMNCRSWTYMEDTKKCNLKASFRAKPRGNSAAASGAPCVNSAKGPISVDCVGVWGECDQGTQTYNVVVPQNHGGAECGLVDGATQSCTVTEDYVWLFEGNCGGRATNLDSLANKDLSECMAACDANTDCIAFNTESVDSKMSGSCQLFQVDGSKPLITRSGNFDNNKHCYQKKTDSERGRSKKHCWTVLPEGCEGLDESTHKVTSVTEWFIDHDGLTDGTACNENRVNYWREQCGVKKVEQCHALDPFDECYYIRSRYGAMTKTIKNVKHDGNICEIDPNTHYTGKNIEILKNVSSAQKCANQCVQNPKCASWTYVKNGERKGHCNIKADIDPDGSQNTCCDSGSACFRPLSAKEIEADLRFKKLV